MLGPHVLLVLFCALEGEVFCEYKMLGGNDARLPILRLIHRCHECACSCINLYKSRGPEPIHALPYIRVWARKVASLLMLFLFEGILLFCNTPKVFSEGATWRILLAFGLFVGFLFALLSILHDCLIVLFRLRAPFSSR